MIERAKGLLMEKDGIDEADAFARMRGASQRTGKPLRDDRRGGSGRVRPGYLTSVSGGRPIRLISRWASASSSRPDTFVRRSSYQTAPCSDTNAITGSAVVEPAQHHRPHERLVEIGDVDQHQVGRRTRPPPLERVAGKRHRGHAPA